MNQIKEQEKTIECSPNEIELTLAQHGFEMPGSTYMWIFNSKCYSTTHSSIQFTQSCPTLWPHGLQHAILPCSSPTPKPCSNSCSSSRWCHRTISSSDVPFSSCLQSFPASGSFSKSQSFTSGGQSIGVSASASVFPMSTQDWFPLRLTGLISLQSKGLSRVFSNTTVQKHLFFSTQPFL